MGVVNKKGREDRSSLPGFMHINEAVKVYFLLNLSYRLGISPPGLEPESQTCSEGPGILDAAYFLKIGG